MSRPVAASRPDTDENSVHSSLHAVLWWSMLALSVLLLVLWLQRGWIASERWPVRWIDISAPEQRVSAEQIRARLRDDLQRGFFSLDLRRMVQQLESLSWVASARVQRSWPDMIKVSIREHRPVAYWNDQQLISDYGVVFASDADSTIRALPRLQGPPARRDEVMQQWLQWRDRLLSIGLRITALQLSERGSWSLQLNNGTSIALGREQLNLRMQRLLAVWPQLAPGNNHPRQIDLRYSNGLAISLPPEAAAVTAGEQQPDNFSRQQLMAQRERE